MITCEADPRHAEEIIRALDLDRANPVTTPMATETIEENDEQAVSRGRRRPATGRSLHGSTT